VTRDGFELARHPLSLLRFGDQGWIQSLNLALSGVMTLAAAVGFQQAPTQHGARWPGRLLAAYGACLISSWVFRPDPMAGFPVGATSGTVSDGGVLHLAFGALGFLLLAHAAIATGRWFARRGDRWAAGWSRAGGAVVGAGFAGGAALPENPAGIACLWLAVVTGWSWLAVSSVVVYRAVPHPLIVRRVPAT
jgi:hypothetical protein